MLRREFYGLLGRARCGGRDAWHMRRRRPEKNMPGRCPWHNRNFSTGSVSIDTVWSAHHTDFAMGEIGMAAMRANHVGAVLQIEVSDGAWVGGRAPGPKSSPRRPCRPPRPTWTKCHDRDGFRRDRDTLLFKKIGTAQNFDVAAGGHLAIRPKTGFPSVTGALTWSPYPRSKSLSGNHG